MNTEYILGYISNTELWGILPLDVVCHFLVGLILIKLGTSIGIRSAYIICIVMTIAGLKEYHDSFTLGVDNAMLGHIKDFTATVIPLGLLTFRVDRVDTVF